MQSVVTGQLFCRLHSVGSILQRKITSERRKSKAKKAIQETNGKRQHERTKRTKKKQGRATRRTTKRRGKTRKEKKKKKQEKKEKETERKVSGRNYVNYLSLNGGGAS